MQGYSEMPFQKRGRLFPKRTKRGICAHFCWRESKREDRIKAAGAPRVSGGQPVAKELRTAEQLSDMIVGALGISEVDVRVRKDHAFGWQPTVVSSPGDSIGYQRRVEEIANRLRFHFDLRE
jgi:hypothetical protein